MPKRGITRAAAEKAVGTLRFAAADKVTAACPIEKGTVCMTAEGVRFETTEDAAIAVGSQWADVPAQAVGRARGIGTVNVVIATHAGVPDAALLAAVETDLQKKREIAVDVEVKAPTEKTVNMSAELTAEQGWTMQEITDAATAALQAYFTGERLGEAVYTAKLASILYGVEGVKNCHLLTPDEDVSVGATELPVLGTVTLAEIGAGESA